MQISKITTKNFRNLSGGIIEPQDGLNVFFGDNAQGKTNILEAVYLCCIGKSARTNDEKELVKFGERFARAEIEFKFAGGAAAVAVSLNSAGRKAAEFNGSAVKFSQLLGRLNCVYFSPDEIRVITGAPQERRHFLDVGLCQVSPAYYTALARFNRILFQRNNLLKSRRGQGGTDMLDTLAAWDANLAKEGARLTLMRADFCKKLSPLASAAHQRLCGGEDISTAYISALDALFSAAGGQKIEQKDAENYYFERLAQTAERDFALGYTTFGAQRDDIKFLINKTDVREFGSQGQQRSAALSIKLAEAGLYAQLVGEMPVILLDDVLSELDRKRQRALMSFCENAQVFITCTKIDAPLLKGFNYARFKVGCGTALRK